MDYYWSIINDTIQSGNRRTYNNSSFSPLTRVHSPLRWHFSKHWTSVHLSWSKGNVHTVLKFSAAQRPVQIISKRMEGQTSFPVRMHCQEVLKIILFLQLNLTMSVQLRPEQMIGHYKDILLCSGHFFLRALLARSLYRSEKRAIATIPCSMCIFINLHDLKIYISKSTSGVQI